MLGKSSAPRWSPTAPGKSSAPRWSPTAPARVTFIGLSAVALLSLGLLLVNLWLSLGEGRSDWEDWEFLTKELPGGEVLRKRGVLAASPEFEVLPGEELTLFWSWHVETLSPESRDLFRCVFDFSNPMLTMENVSRLEWTPRVGEVHLFNLTLEKPLVVSEPLTWISNDGRVAKCRVPKPPKSRMLEDLQYVTVVPSLIDDNGDVLPTAARIRVRVDGWDRYQDDTVQRYDANGQDNEVCICTLVYNQGAFLREFIEYHRLVGVSAFIFYDNNSDDDTEEVLSPYLCSDRVGEDGLAVRVVNWNFPNFKFFPSRDWPQKQAFAHCLEQFGARPEDDMELRMDGTYKTVHKGNRHQLRAQDEKRPQCGYISFTDTDEFIVPDPFIARDAMEPSEEIPRIVRKYRANETADNGVMTIVMPPYTVGHSNVIEVPPKMRSHRLELFTHRSRNVTRGEKRLVARKYYPALANRIHIWGRSFANFEYDSDALRSIEAMDFDRRCPSDAPPECDPEPELAMYHHRWGSWKDFISKWKYYGNLKVNTTFVNEVDGRLSEANAAGTDQYWPSVDEMRAYLFNSKTALGHYVKATFLELEQSEELNNLYDIQRYFPKLYKAVQRSTCVPHQPSDNTNG